VFAVPAGGTYSPNPLARFLAGLFGHSLLLDWLTCILGVAYDCRVWYVIDY